MEPPGGIFLSYCREIKPPKSNLSIGMRFWGALVIFVFMLASAPLSAQEGPAQDARVETSEDEAPVSAETSEEVAPGTDAPDTEASSTRAEDVKALRDQLDASREAQKESAAAAKQAKLIAQTLRAEIETPGFPELVQQSLLQRSVAAEIRASLALSREVALGESLKTQQEYLEQVLGESAGERGAREKAAAQEEERRRIEERDSEAEKEAVDAVAKAREMESHERDVTLRELLARQRKAAEETLALTRSHRELMETIRATFQSRSEEFATQKGEFLTRIDAFSDQPSPDERRDHVDPLFRELVQARGRSRQRFAEVLSARQRAEEAMEQAQRRFDEAKQRLLRVQATEVSEVVSEIYQRRLEAAEAEVSVAEKAFDASREVFDERQKQYEENEQRLAFYGDEIPRLLPKISDSARRDFFEFSDRNIAYALAGVQEGFHHILRDIDTQLIKPSELNLASVDLWRWLWGLVWRTLLALVLIRMLVPRVSEQIARATDALLKRHFFREHARTTVRLSDALDALGSLPLYFLGARFLAHYILPDELIAGFPTLIIFRWALNAFFLYWVLVDLARVFALPRWFRRTKQNLQTRLDLLFLDVAAPADAANDPQLKRGRKLVRSVRVVVFFWLVSKYVPEAARLVIGVSFFTWVIDFVARWSLFGIIYWVLSTWKDNIAALFERLAGRRIPRAVEVVNTRKDAFYGVFIIAAASVYVLGSELIRVARKYLLNTELFRQISTLIFRAKIELRNRDEESSDEAASAEILPADYIGVWNEYAELGNFAAEGAGRGELISGAGEFERLTTTFHAWLDEGARGSAVIVGEPGAGKSTLLRHFEQYVSAHKSLDCAKDASVERSAVAPRKTPKVICADVRKRISTKEEVLEFVAELFGLKIAPGTGEAQLLERIKALDPHVIILRNSHALFLRRIGGFDGLQTLFHIISSSDKVHFYALTFNIFAWSYVNRVRTQSHFFVDVIRLKPWTDKELQKLIESRTNKTDYRIDFSQLLKSRDPDANLQDASALEKTARGYFRYLQEFCGGNPRLAITYWLRSLHVEEPKGSRSKLEGAKKLQVSLFRRPSTAAFTRQTDAHWFVLTAIAQHGHLNAAEIAQAVHLEEGFCDLMLRLFAEADLVDIDPQSGQASLSPLYYRQVLKHLAQSNFLYE